MLIKYRLLTPAELYPGASENYGDNFSMSEYIEADTHFATLDGVSFFADPHFPLGSFYKKLKRWLWLRRILPIGFSWNAKDLGDSTQISFQNSDRKIKVRIQIEDQPVIDQEFEINPFVTELKRFLHEFPSGVLRTYKRVI